MNIKLRLTIQSFLQFFIWGAWLITIGDYWFHAEGWGSAEFGLVFSTLGIASIIMPPIVGIIADRWINSERLYGILMILYSIPMFYLPSVDNPHTFLWVMMIAMLFYMPTIALSNAVPYHILKDNNYDVVKVFPPIRVWGTIGFIAAMWVVNLSGNKFSANQFYLSALAGLILGIYNFTLPACRPLNKIPKNANLTEKLGLNAFKLFKEYKMLIFFLFSLLLGAALQLTNMYGDAYLSSFAQIPKFQFSWAVEYSTILMSVSQMSETLFILSIPFFLKRYGIKKVMLMSMFAWVLRFGFFAFGDPGGGVWLFVLSMVVYGMAFDFFNISGSLFVETTTSPKIRSSAQGVFIMMTNGFGAMLGSIISGYIIKYFFTLPNGNKEWFSIWIAFACYALIIAILFAILFKHKHNREEMEKVVASKK